MMQKKVFNRMVGSNTNWKGPIHVTENMYVLKVIKRFRQNPFLTTVERKIEDDADIASQLVGLTVCFKKYLSDSALWELAQLAVNTCYQETPRRKHHGTIKK